MLFECAIVAGIFGSTPILNKYILTHISVETFISLLSVFYFVAVVLYASLSNLDVMYVDIRNLQKNIHVYPLIIISAVSTMIVANYFYSKLLMKNRAYIITAIISSYPAITAILGYFLLNDTITSKQIVGIFMCIIGVLLLSS